MSARGRILFVVAGMSLVGCASQSALNLSAAKAPADMPIAPRDLEELPVDRYCEVRMLGKTPGYSAVYTGKIVKSDGDSLTLTHIQKTHRQARRMFRNTGIGLELVDGEETIPREEISEVTMLTPEASAWYASRRTAGVASGDAQAEATQAAP